MVCAHNGPTSYYQMTLLFIVRREGEIALMVQWVMVRRLPGPQTKRRTGKGGKLNTSQAESVAASRAALGQFLFISREAFILRTRYIPAKIHS